MEDEEKQPVTNYKKRYRPLSAFLEQEMFQSYPLTHGKQLKALLKASVHYPGIILVIFVNSSCGHCKKRKELWQKLHQYVHLVPFFVDDYILEKEEEDVSIQDFLHEHNVEMSVYPSFLRMHKGKILEAQQFTFYRTENKELPSFVWQQPPKEYRHEYTAYTHGPDPMKFPLMKFPYPGTDSRNFDLLNFLCSVAA